MSEVRERTRRQFLRDAGLTVALLAGAEALRAEQAPEAPRGPPVNCGVIGLGPQGRELLSVLSRLPNAPVGGICDTYAPMVNRGKEIAPKAKTLSDYRQLLDDKSIQAVFVATPSHLHREVAIAAVQAGKHVYCEAPLASTIDDARYIAQAGKFSKQVFQVGQQARANPQHNHVWTFMKIGALGGKVAQARAQWHQKKSWRQAASNPERERAVNWRLQKETSAGLMGEIGIHQVDVASWYLKSLPVSVTGFGAVTFWKEDRREVPDTVQCVFEYPGGTHLTYDATLVNSFDNAYELFMGSDSAVVLRDQRAWLVKESDAPLLGWEVYARKVTVGDQDVGIVLIADATKLLALGKNPAEAHVEEAGKTPLYFSVEDFLTCVREKKPARCGPVEGYQAAVVAIKANEAVLSGTRIDFQKEWFDVAGTGPIPNGSGAAAAAAKTSAPAKPKPAAGARTRRVPVRRK